MNDYRRMLEMKEIDAIITSSAWESHVVCIDSMLAGKYKYVATEVGGAYSINQCWELVRTYERSVPCMMLENCYYGKEKMTVLKMRARRNYRVDTQHDPAASVFPRKPRTEIKGIWFEDTYGVLFDGLADGPS